MVRDRPKKAVCLSEVRCIELQLLIPPLGRFSRFGASRFETHWVLEFALRITLQGNLQSQVLGIERVYTRPRTIFRVNAAVPTHNVSHISQVVIDAHAPNLIH